MPLLWWSQANKTPGAGTELATSTHNIYNTRKAGKWLDDKAIIKSMGDDASGNGGGLFPTGGQLTVSNGAPRHDQNKLWINVATSVFFPYNCTKLQLTVSKYKKSPSEYATHRQCPWCCRCQYAAKKHKVQYLLTFTNIQECWSKRCWKDTPYSKINRLEKKQRTHKTHWPIEQNKKTIPS